MIKTNLLPPELQTKKARAKLKAEMKAGAKGVKGGKGAPVKGGGGGGGAGIPFPMLVTMILIVAIVVGGGGGFMAWTKISAAQKKEKDAVGAEKRKKDAYDLEVNRYQKEFDEWARMKTKEEILAQLMPEERLLWAEKLSMLSDLVPEDVFITSLQVTEKIEMVETDYSKKVRDEWKQKEKIAKERDAKTAKIGTSAAAASAAEGEKKKTTTPEKKGPAEAALPPQPKPQMRPSITQELTIQAVTLYNEQTGAHRGKYIEMQENMNKNAEFRKFFETLISRDPRTLEEVEKIQIAPGAQEKIELDGVDVWSFDLKLTTIKT